MQDAESENNTSQNDCPNVHRTLIGISQLLDKMCLKPAGLDHGPWRLHKTSVSSRSLKVLLVFLTDNEKCPVVV